MQASNASEITIHLCEFALRIFSIQPSCNTFESMTLEIFSSLVLGNASIHRDTTSNI